MKKENKFDWHAKGIIATRRKGKVFWYFEKISKNFYASLEYKPYQVVGRGEIEHCWIPVKNPPPSFLKHLKENMGIEPDLY